jgi:hypothetical protein
MIQRIQSIFLFLVVIITGGLPFVFNLWKLQDNTLVYANNHYLYISFFISSALLSLMSIFSFKKRQNQFVLNRLNMILNLILLGLFVYRTLNLSGEATVSEKGIGIFLPVVAIFLLVLANRAIKKDDDLVKSVDRLR